MKPIPVAPRPPAQRYLVGAFLLALLGALLGGAIEWGISLQARVASLETRVASLEKVTSADVKAFEELRFHAARGELAAQFIEQHLLRPAAALPVKK
jgi:hypothetical protein